MRDSKLVNILKSFSPEEIKSFEKFIISPYFSIGRDVCGLYSAVKRHYPEFNSDELERENLFSKLFPDEGFNESKLKNLASALTSQAEQFLIHNSIKSDEIEAGKLLAVQYKERDNEKMFFNNLHLLEKKISGNLFNSSDCFKEEEDIEQLRETFYFKKDDYNKSVPSKVKHAELFTLTFLIRFLRMLADKPIITDGYNMPFENTVIDAVTGGVDFDKIMNALKEKKYDMLWLLQIYYYSLKIASVYDGNPYYDKLKTIFIENIDKFTRNEKYILFNSLLFYCTKNYVQTHNHSYLKECFEIYKEMLEHSAYSRSEDEYLNITVYRNIFFMAFGLKEFAWLYEFIEKYTDRLNPEYRTNTMNLTKAYLFFEHNEFEDSLHHINRVQYDISPIKLDVKNLQLRIYYELDILDQAFAMIDSYRHFLDENKEFSKPYKLQYYNFINLYTKLIKAKSNNTNSAAEIITEANKSESLAYKNWLIEKAKELAEEK